MKKILRTLGLILFVALLLVITSLSVWDVYFSGCHDATSFAIELIPAKCVNHE